MKWRFSFNAAAFARIGKEMRVMSFAIGAMLLMPDLAFAGVLSTWDQAIATLACTLIGPWLKWVAVIAIVIAGASFAVGEMNGPMKTAMNIVAGISIALGAASMVGLLFSDSSFNESSCSVVRRS